MSPPMAIQKHAISRPGRSSWQHHFHGLVEPWVQLMGGQNDGAIRASLIASRIANPGTHTFRLAVGHGDASSQHYTTSLCLSLTNRFVVLCQSFSCLVLLFPSWHLANGLFQHYGPRRKRHMLLEVRWSSCVFN